MNKNILTQKILKLSIVMSKLKFLTLIILILFTGISTVTFVVPKTSKTFLPGSYLLTVTNKVGTGQTYFTVNP